MTRIQRLERRAKEAGEEWNRACDYTGKVAADAQKRHEWNYFSGPARKRYEGAVKALEREKLKGKT